jgi:hypothetical protein
MDLDQLLEIEEQTTTEDGPQQPAQCKSVLTSKSTSSEPLEQPKVSTRGTISQAVYLELWKSPWGSVPFPKTML